MKKLAWGIGGIAILAMIVGMSTKTHGLIPVVQKPATSTTAQNNHIIPPPTTLKTSSTTSSTIKTAPKKPATPQPKPLSSTTLPYLLNNLPLATTTPVTTAPTQVPSNVPPEISIDPQTIVGVLCDYRITYTNDLSGKRTTDPDLWEVRGSGVIINSRGNVLTNRHVIEQPESYTSITDNRGQTIPITVDYALDHCEVGQLPASAHLPTIPEIQSINPYVQIPVLAYTAQPVYVPTAAGLSSIESENIDFAILKLTGVTQDGATFGITTVPASFPYAKLLPTRPYPLMDNTVITYGFPGNVTSGQGNFFETFTMTGSVGHITQLEFGDKFFADTPLIVRTNLEIAHGRSGSPLFWRGYVIGLVTFFIGNNDTNSGSVASDAIIKSLQQTDYLPL